MARNLTLINDAGTSYNLNDLASLAHDVTGLGSNLDYTFTSLEDSYIEQSRVVSQSDITFKLMFGGKSKQSAYEDFRKFSEFLSNGPLYLQYTYVDTNSTVKSYLRQVVVKSLAKSELNEYDVLDDELTLTPVDTWFTSTDYKLTNQQSVELYNNSHKLLADERAGILIKITSQFSGSLHWTLGSDSDGLLVGLDSGSTLYVDSRPAQRRAYIVKGNLVTDVYQLLDFTKTNFVKAPKGTSTLTFDKPVTGTVTVYEGYTNV